MQVGSYSVRPTERATVSRALDWSALERGAPDPDDYRVDTVLGLVEREGDRLAAWMKRPQALPG